MLKFYYFDMYETKPRISKAFLSVLIKWRKARKCTILSYLKNNKPSKIWHS